MLGALLGFLAGIGIAIAIERLDRRIRTRADAEEAYGLPVLAEVPELSSSQQRTHEIVCAHPAALGYRGGVPHRAFVAAVPVVDPWRRGAAARCRARVRCSPTATTEPLVVMVTSALPNVGKSTSSANLGVVFAEAGSRTLVLNCDFRRPKLHEFFGIPNEARRVHATPLPNLKVVTSVLDENDPNPARVVAMQRQLINTARGKFDVIILDTAPVLSANDALEVMPDVDLVVVVARAEISRTPAAHRAMDMLNRRRCPARGPGAQRLRGTAQRVLRLLPAPGGAPSWPEERCERHERCTGWRGRRNRIRPQYSTLTSRSSP